MKILQLVTLAGFIVLGGCASTAPNNNAASNSDDRAVPLGTLFAKKGATASDPSSKVNMQSLENERTMGNNGLTIRQ